MEQRAFKLWSRIMSAMLAAVMIFACMGTAVWGATRQMSDIASATLGDTVEIGTAEELFAFADYVNSGKNGSGIIFKLTADIVLNDMSDFTVWSEGYAPAKIWTPIGDYDKPFSGTFDGDGHTISGIYINTVSNYQGLFGHVKNGTVKNVGVTQSYIKGGDNVGGVVGYADFSTVTNCYNAGSVKGNWFVGGVAGSISNMMIFTNCYNIGTVAGSNNVGGVVGYADSSTVTNCYNTGSVTGSNNVGGVAGFFLGLSEAANCYYLEGSSTTAIGTLGEGGTATTDTFNISGVLTSANNNDPNGVSITENTTTLLTALNAWVTANQTTPESYSSWTGTVYPVFSTVSVPIWSGSAATGFASGTGDRGYPYIIETAEQLKYFADQVKSGTTYAGQYIRLAADLVLNADAENYASWGTEAPTNAHEWTPIGFNANKPFSGTFDGDGHTIIGIYIKSNFEYQGLFGYVKNGMVKNVGVTQSYIKGKNYVGGVVGYADSSEVTNSYNTGSVTGSNNVGGVVGYADSSEVTNSYKTGSVSGSGNIVGGVVGHAYYSPVFNCYNAGSVTGSDKAGGVAGLISGSTVTNCYNAGLVRGTGASAKVGGVAGEIWGSSTTPTVVTNCYYLEGSAMQAVGSGTATTDTFNISGVLTSANNNGKNGVSITANTTTLLTALNAWVAKQTTPALYSSWTGTIYPVFPTVGVPIWSGSADTGFARARGNGSEADPYIIETAEQLKYFADQV